MRKPSSVVLVIASLATACGGSTGSTSPTPLPASSSSPTGVNRPPEIIVASVTPSTGGWHYLTTYTAHIEARDPDGDRLTYAWTGWKGQPIEGVFANGGTDVSFIVQGFQDDPKNVGPLTVTVNDPRGGTASTTIQFEALYLRNQRFFGRVGAIDYIRLLLNQTGDSLSGIFHDPRRNPPPLLTQTDPARPGRIDTQGNFTNQFDLPQVGRLTLVGQVSGGYRYQLTGTAYGGGFAGERFSFAYDDGY